MLLYNNDILDYDNGWQQIYEHFIPEYNGDEFKNKCAELFKEDNVEKLNQYSKEVLNKEAEDSTNSTGEEVNDFNIVINAASANAEAARKAKEDADKLEQDLITTYGDREEK